MRHLVLLTATAPPRCITSHSRRVDQNRGLFLGTLSLSRRPIAVENQADGVRALARRYRRRIAPAVRFQCVADRPRVTGLPIFGLRNEFVATWRDQLQAARH